METLNGTRIFARLISFWFECPRCARIYQVRPGKRTAWYNPRTQVFQCQDCGLTLGFGLLMYPILAGGRPRLKIPEDSVPNTRQAAAIRQLQAGVYLDDSEARPHGTRPRNRVIRKATCLCEVRESGGRTTHPGCPVHGAGAAEPGGDPPAPS